MLICNILNSTFEKRPNNNNENKKNEREREYDNNNGDINDKNTGIEDNDGYIKVCKEYTLTFNKNYPFVKSPDLFLSNLKNRLKYYSVERELMNDNFSLDSK